VSEIAVSVVDVGRGETTDWWRLVCDADGALVDAGAGGTSLDELVEAIASDLEAERKVALGFDAPLTVPMPGDEERLGRIRRGAHDRPWPPGAAKALGHAAQQVTWVLMKLSERLGENLPTIGWDPHTVIAEGYRSLLIWEVAVYGRPGGGSGVSSARVGAEEFVRRLAAGDVGSDIGTPAHFWTPRGRPLKKLDERAVFNLAGAGLLRAGLTTDVKVLSDQPWVVRAHRAAPSPATVTG
jgi:hypothetical protein